MRGSGGATAGARQAAVVIRHAIAIKGLSATSAADLAEMVATVAEIIDRETRAPELLAENARLREVLERLERELEAARAALKGGRP